LDKNKTGAIATLKTQNKPTPQFVEGIPPSKPSLFNFWGILNRGLAKTLHRLTSTAL
jgi:hypothetical protein